MVKCIDYGDRLNTGSDSSTGSGVIQYGESLTTWPYRNPCLGEFRRHEGNWGESGMKWPHLILNSASPHGGPRVVRGVRLGRSTAKVTQLDHPSSTQ